VERIASPGKNPLDSIISDEEHEKTVGYVTRLPELYRTVAMKRVIDGMKYNEIAEDLGMGLNTVKTRIKRAKAMVDRMRADDEGK
jgi:RNA polymerase sigma-70 factor (ECF subfamily)